MVDYRNKVEKYSKLLLENSAKRGQTVLITHGDLAYDIAKELIYEHNLEVENYGDIDHLDKMASEEVLVVLKEGNKVTLDLPLCNDMVTKVFVDKLESSYGNLRVKELFPNAEVIKRV